MEIHGVSACTLAESREGVGEADRKEDKDAGHVVRAKVKKIQRLTLQQPTYPERHILISSPHKATRNMKHWKTQKLNTTQIFQYTQNKVAQPDCINHLLKKYLLLYCMNKLEEAQQALTHCSPLCVSVMQTHLRPRVSLLLLTRPLDFTSNDLG